MCSPSPPPAPDYTGAAQAQGAANKDAAIATSNLSNPNVVGPYGTTTYAEGANPGDRPTMTQTLSPDQQKLLDQSDSTKLQLGQLGSQGATALQGIVGKPLDLSEASPAPGAPGQIRSDVVNAMMGRVDTDTANQRSQKQSDLVAAGIRPGTKAYDDQMSLIDRGYNDARQQAITAGTSAAAQDYAQTAQSRQQSIAELLAQRQTPLNEVSALMSGSQVSNPFAQPGYSGANVAPAPIAQGVAQQGQYGTDIYNQGAASASSTQSGLMGLAGTGAMAFAL